MTVCGAVGALMVGGRVVGQLRCEMSEGHRRECERCRWNDGFGAGEPIGHDHPEAHRVALTWTPEAEPDLDLFDPAESFDVDVPIVSSGICLVPGCERDAAHEGLHDIYPEDDGRGRE